MSVRDSCGVIRRLRIRYWKQKARKALTAYFDIMEKHGCGHHLLQYISSGAIRHKNRFNEIMAILDDIDPDSKGLRLTEKGLELAQSQMADVQPMSDLAFPASYSGPEER